MALGARSYQVLWIILRDTLQMTILGTAIGVFLAIGSGTLVENQLFGLSSTDPTTLMLATFAIVAVALFAGYWPARRAMQVDPMVALRHE